MLARQWPADNNEKKIDEMMEFVDFSKREITLEAALRHVLIATTRKPINKDRSIDKLKH
jgi:hypothetical protein